MNFSAFRGTDPRLRVWGTPRFDLRDLVGALVLGVLCGIGARLFTMALAASKRLTAGVNPLLRAVVASAGLAGLVAISYGAFGSGLTLGAGYDNVTWALD